MSAWDEIEMTGHNPTVYLDRAEERYYESRLDEKEKARLFSRGYLEGLTTINHMNCNMGKTETQYRRSKK